MAVTGKALSAVTTTYATLQAGDIMAWERASLVGKTTWAQFQTQDMTLTGAINMSGATVTWDGGPLDVLAGTSITSVSGADLALITGTAGADGNLAQWNADGDLVDGPDLDTTISDYVTGYTSTDQTITAGGLLTLAHSLGAAPTRLSLRIKCTDAGGDVGFAQNDVVWVDFNTTDGTNTRSNAVYADATNVYVRFSPGATGAFAIANKSTGASALITNSKWALIVQAGL